MIPEYVVTAFKNRDDKIISHYIVADMYPGDICDAQGNTMLHLAARYDNQTMLKLYVDQYPKAAKNCVDKLNLSNQTALNIAQTNCSPSVAANTNLESYSEACEKLKYSISHYDANTISSWAPSDRDINVFSYLFALGANPNISDNEGNTPLHLCALHLQSPVRDHRSEEKAREIAKILLTVFGANKEIPNNNGETFKELQASILVNKQRLLGQTNSSTIDQSTIRQERSYSL